MDAYPGNTLRKRSKKQNKPLINERKEDDMKKSVLILYMKSITKRTG